MPNGKIEQGSGESPWVTSALKGTLPATDKSKLAPAFRVQETPKVLVKPTPSAQDLLSDEMAETNLWGKGFEEARRKRAGLPTIDESNEAVKEKPVKEVVVKKKKKSFGQQIKDWLNENI